MSHTHDRIRVAAQNNAHWCTAVCGSHGDQGHMHDSLWLHAATAPRFYPNAVTLEAGAELVMPKLRELLIARRHAAWGVKDSFANLDLTVFGGRVLFSAQWLWLSAPAQADSAGAPGFAHVRDEAELVRWERAWNRGPFAESERVFLPGLLDDDNAVVFRWGSGDAIEAGAIAYRAAGVVGLSNVFGRDSELHRVYRAAVAAAVQHFPGLPLVDYAAGEAFSAARTVGFEAVGPLRVWVNAQSAG